jgi:hypothetical protein
MHFQNTHQQKDRNMCQKCNDALLAAANASLMLASAAEKLYGINQQAQAQVLAEASAELFKPVKEERRSGETAAMPGNPEDVKPSAGDQPQPWHIDPETGVLYINEVAIGRAVLVKAPVRH